MKMKGGGGDLFINVFGSLKVSLKPKSRRRISFAMVANIYSLHQLPSCKITTKFNLNKLK